METVFIDKQGCIDGKPAPLIKIDRKLPFTVLIPQHIENFNAVQSAFYTRYKGGSALVSSTTGTGKTICAHMALKDVTKFVYIVPARALAEQVVMEFMKYRKVSLKTGDPCTSVKYPAVVCTMDVFVAAIRNRVRWAMDVETIVVDESHFLLDTFGERSLCLEEAISYCLSRKIKIIMLSGSFPGIKDVANWIKPDCLVESIWRPIPLERNYVFYDKEDDEGCFETIVNLIKSSRESKDSEPTKIFLVPSNKQIGWSWLRRLEEEHGLRALNRTVPNSWAVTRKPLDTPPVVAFHNAEVPREERLEIGDSFTRPGGISIIIATQTLAYGFNSPTDLVIVAPTVRKVATPSRLYHKISPGPLDIMQFEGRAGRMGHCKSGTAKSIIVTTKESQPYVQEELETCMDRSFNTTLGLEQLTLNTVSYILLGALSLSNGDYKAATDHVRNYYKGSEIYDSGFLEMALAFLKKADLVDEDNSITDEGRIVASSCLYPHLHLEVKRRLERLGANRNIDTLILSIRPLIRRSFHIPDDFLDSRTISELIEFKKKCGNLYPGEEDGSNLLFYSKGGFVRSGKVPTVFADLSIDMSRLAGFLSEMGMKGYYNISIQDVVRITHSLSIGIPVNYSLFSGVSGIGMVRGNMLAALGKKLFGENGNDLMLYEAIREDKEGVVSAIEDLCKTERSRKGVEDAVNRVSRHQALYLGNPGIYRSIGVALFGKMFLEPELEIWSIFLNQRMPVAS